MGVEVVTFEHNNGYYSEVTCVVSGGTAEERKAKLDNLQQKVRLVSQVSSDVLAPRREEHSVTFLRHYTPYDTNVFGLPQGDLLRIGLDPTEDPIRRRDAYLELEETNRQAAAHLFPHNRL